jgi:hypothetical protein
VTGHVRRFSGEEFSELFQSFRTSAFRLECLSEYRTPNDVANMDAYLEGKPLPLHSFDAWCDLVRDAVSAGKEMSRVHVIPSRLTPYLRYEIEWGYAYAAEAGERILLLQHDVPAQVLGTWPVSDFWLFDDAIAVRMQYAEDGRFEWAERIMDGDMIDEYRRIRDTATAEAVPLQTYLARVRAAS